MVTMEVPMSQLPAYHKLSQEKIFALQARCGYKWVANWQRIVGDIEEVIGVAEFASMDDDLAARKKLLASAAWAAVAPHLDTMSRGIRTRLLRATSYRVLRRPRPGDGSVGVRRIQRSKGSPAGRGLPAQLQQVVAQSLQGALGGQIPIPESGSDHPGTRKPTCQPRLTGRTLPIWPLVLPSRLAW